MYRRQPAALQQRRAALRLQSRALLLRLVYRRQPAALQQRRAALRLQSRALVLRPRFPPARPLSAQRAVLLAAVAAVPQQIPLQELHQARVRRPAVSPVTQ